jgi:hypothetical protein
MQIEQPPSGLAFGEAVREWLALLAAFAAATFAGLIWWLARQRLSTRFTLTADGPRHDGYLEMRISILNRGDNPLLFDAISVRQPFSILANNQGSAFGTTAGQAQIASAKKVQKVGYPKSVLPEASGSWGFLLAHPDKFASCKSVSIRLHMSSNRFAIRHNTKVLTAMLTATTRDAKSSA